MSEHEKKKKPYPQRNTSGYVLTVPSLGREFGPGEEVEHDQPITGFTPVDQIDDEPATPSKTKRAEDSKADGGKETVK